MNELPLSCRSRCSSRRRAGDATREMTTAEPPTPWCTTAPIVRGTCIGVERHDAFLELRWLNDGECETGSETTHDWSADP